MPQDYLPQGDTAVGGNSFTAPEKEPKKKKQKTPVAPTAPVTADVADYQADQEAKALRQVHRQEVIDRRAGRAERQIARQSGQYLRENTLYNAPERQQILDGINTRVGLVDPRLLARNPALAAELVMGTTKTSQLGGASTAAYQGWKAQQEDLAAVQEGRARAAYAHTQMELQRADPQGYAIGQAIGRDPVLTELTAQVSSIKWLSPEKRAFLMEGIIQATRMDGVAYEAQVGGIQKQIVAARRGTLEIPEAAPSEGLGEFLHMAQEGMNIIPFAISKGVDIGQNVLPDELQSPVDAVQEAVGDTLGAAGTGATFLARGMESAAVGITSLGQHGIRAALGKGAPEGGYLTADEIWNSWGEIEDGEHGAFSVVLARSLDTDINDPRYQNLFTLTDMTADLVGQAAMFKGLSTTKEVMRNTIAGGGRFTGAQLVDSYVLGGRRLMSSIWESIEDVPVSKRPQVLVDSFKKGMTPTLARDLSTAVTKDQAVRTMARHLDDVPDLEIPKAQARLDIVKEDMRHTGLGPEMDALKAEKAALEQRIWDLNKRETIYEFPRISHIRPFMRGIEARGPVGRITGWFFKPLREGGSLDLSRIFNDLTADAAKLVDPASITRTEGWASHNFEVLRKTMDVIKVDKAVQNFVLEAMWEVERGNISFYTWRRMIEDAYRSGKRYTPDMEEGIRLSVKTRYERMHAPVEVGAEGGSFLRNAAEDGQRNPLPVRVSQLLEDEVALPSMSFLEAASSMTSRLDSWAKTQPALVGKTFGALRTTTGWTSFIMFQGPRLIMRPLLLALNPKMFAKIEVDQSLRAYFKAGVTPLDWWSVKARLFKKKPPVDLVEGGIPTEPPPSPTLANRLPEKDGAPDYTATGLIANEMETGAIVERSPYPTSFDPTVDTKGANLVAEGVADHILALASDPLTQRIARDGADATIRFFKENPHHPTVVEWNERVRPRLEAAAAERAEALRPTSVAELTEKAEFDPLTAIAEAKQLGTAHADTPIKVRINEDGTWSLIDGAHRINEAMRTGREMVDVRFVDESGTAFDPVADAIRQQELEIKQAAGGDAELQRAIGTENWRGGEARPAPALEFVEDELVTARDAFARATEGFERETLALRIEQLERKADGLRRQRTTSSTNIRDKDALAARIKDEWIAGRYTPTKEVMVNRRLAGHAPGSKLEAAKQWARTQNERIYGGRYSTFKLANPATRDMSRGSLYRKVLDRTEQRLLDLGYSPERALSAAQFRASFITKDLMYDISARSTIDRKLQELFWFEPVWREQLSVWLVKMPSNAFWAPGLALEYGMAHTLLQGLKDIGFMEDSEDYVDPETGNTIPGRPYLNLGPLGQWGVGGFNPLSPGSETMLPTISPGAEQIFDFAARHVPEEFRPWFEAFADKFTFDRNVESTPWMPRGVALVASNIIGVAEFFGANLDGITIGAIGEARRNSEIKGRQWAISDMIDEGIKPPTQGENESDEEFYARLADYEAQVEARARRYSVGLDFLFTLNATVFPGSLKDAGTAPEGVAWRQWRYEDGPLADVEPGDMAPWQYDIQNAYLAAHPEQWPWAVGGNKDLDPDPDIYNPAPLTAEEYTDKAIEQYHYWGDPPDAPDHPERELTVTRDATVFNSLEPRKQAKLVAQWATNDIDELTPFQADTLGLPSFEGREDLMATFGAINRQYENKYAYDKSDAIKAYLRNERDFLLEKAAAEYGEDGQALLDYITSPLVQRLTTAGALTTPEVGVVKAKAAQIRREVFKDYPEASMAGAAESYGLLEKKADLFRLVDSLRRANPAFDRELRYVELGLGEKDGPVGKIEAYQYIFFGEPFYASDLAPAVLKEMHR